MTAPSMDESLVVFSRIPLVRPPGGCRGDPNRSLGSVGRPSLVGVWRPSLEGVGQT